MRVIASAWPSTMVSPFASNLRSRFAANTFGAIIATIVLQFTGLDLKPFIEPAAEVVTEVVADSPALPETVTTTNKVSK